MSTVPVPRNALVLKELRTRMRSFRSTVIIMAYMAVLAVIAIAFLVMQQGPSATGSSSDIGVRLYQALCIFQLFLILFIIPATTAGAISGERQRQTWDLLLVTRLSRFGIVWGKLLTGVGFGILLLFASMPLFSLVFLFGGVEPADIVHTYLVFLATIIFLGTASLFISATTRRLVVSMVVSNVVALMLGVGLSLLTIYLFSTSVSSGVIVRGPGPYHPPPQPTLTPLAQLDPLVALLSALPNGSGGSILGGRLATIHHAFGLPFTLDLWRAYVSLALVLTLLLLGATTLLVRFTPSWLSRENE
jgi:ABC-type transport system involved in multi-copper enzyme maturation permease subunit